MNEKNRVIHISEDEREIIILCLEIGLIQLKNIAKPLKNTDLYPDEIEKVEQLIYRLKKEY